MQGTDCMYKKIKKKEKISHFFDSIKVRAKQALPLAGTVWRQYFAVSV